HGQELDAARGRRRRAPRRAAGHGALLPAQPQQPYVRVAVVGSAAAERPGAQPARHGHPVWARRHPRVLRQEQPHDGHPQPPAGRRGLRDRPRRPDGHRVLCAQLLRRRHQQGRVHPHHARAGVHLPQVCRRAAPQRQGNGLRQRRPLCV
ncbi:hypothetical protein IWQ56_002706, partial [Coemansia nantahalensis]